MAIAVGVIRSIARNMMPELIRIGVSRRGVQRWLQQAYGQAYRWDVLRQDYNEFLGVFTHQFQVDAMNSIERPIQRFMIETDLPAVSQYRIMGKATVYDRESGETYEKWTGMYTDEPLSQEEYFDKLTELYDVHEDYKKYDLISVDVKAYYHNRGLPY